MIVIEEGISNKSFAISMVATLLGFAAMITCLSIFTTATPNWIQIPAALGTVLLFVVGMAAWAGKLEKKKAITHEFREDTQVQEPPKLEKVKPAPKEDWAAKWLKENK